MCVPILKRRYIVVILTIMAALLIWLLFGSNILQAGTIPTPPPIPTLSPGSTPVPSSVPFGNGPADQTPPAFLVTIPSFAGKVLHWTQTSYTYNTLSPDPANGRPTNVDIWIQVGADGIPIIARSVSTFLDGTFHQANLYASDATTFILGPGYQAVSPHSFPECVLNEASYPVETRRSLLPPFVDEAMLPQFGFNQESGKATMQFPSTESLPEGKALETYGPDTTVRRWIMRESANRSTNLKALEVGEGGRVLGSQAQLTSAEGDIVNETWTAYGPLEVYDPASVPTSVFDLSEQALGACHD